MKYHHSLDVHPIPKEKTPMYINEPWLVDNSLLEYPMDRKQPDEEKQMKRMKWNFQ